MVEALTSTEVDTEDAQKITLNGNFSNIGKEITHNIQLYTAAGCYPCVRGHAGRIPIQLHTKPPPQKACKLRLYTFILPLPPVLEAKLQSTDNISDVMFPEEDESFSTEPQFERSAAMIIIPKELLTDRAAQTGLDAQNHVWTDSDIRKEVHRIGHWIGTSSIHSAEKEIIIHIDVVIGDLNLLTCGTKTGNYTTSSAGKKS